MRTKLIALVGAGLLLSACAGEPAPAVTVETTVTASPEAVPSPTPSPTTASPLATGETADFGQFSMTVHGVDLDPAPEPGPQPQRAEDKWASADVEYCTDADTTVTDYWWRLHAADNRQYSASSTGYETFPEPAYAWGEVPVSAGTCHRGWITFVVGKDAQLTTVGYQNDRGDAARWAIG